MRLTRKLPLVMVGLAVGASLVTGFLALTKFERELKRSEQSQLVALLEARSAELTRFFAAMRAELVLYARNPAVQEAMAEFASAYATLDLQADAAGYLTAAYSGNGKWHTADSDADRYADYYRQVHEEFHPWLLESRINRDLRDILFIDPQGNVIYSTAKSADFGADLTQGALAKTALGDVFRRIKPNPTGLSTATMDLAAYGPADGAPVMFMAAPVFSRTQNWIGIAVLEIPVTPINAILAAKRGMGETGETYVIGGDYLMRSQSRFIPDSTVLKVRVDGSAARRAMAGESDVGLTTDYRGTPVYSAFAPVSVGDFPWALLSEVDEEEVQARVRSARTDMLWILTSMAAVLLLIGTFMARRVARPIGRVTKAMTGLATGNLEVRVDGRGRADEIGMLVRSFETLRENEAERLRLADEVRKQHLIAQAALENMGQALVMADAEGRLVARNARFAEQFGLDAERVVDGTPFLQVTEDLAACAGSADDAACHWLRGSDSRTDPDSIELALADGRTYEVRHTPLAQGGFVHTYTNISERKENERRLRESERQLIEILNSSPVGAGISRMSDGRVTFVNARQCELLGLTEAEMLARTRSDFYPDTARADEMARLFREQGAVHGFEIDMRRGDGSVFPALMSVLPMAYGGEASRLVWIFDLSDIKAAQAEVERGREQMLAILEASPIGVAIARRDDGAMLYANGRQAELLGVDLDAYLSGPTGAYWADPADRQRVNAAMARDGLVRDAEVRMRRADGTEFWALVSGLYFDYGGEPARMGWFYDITQRKEAEQELARTLDGLNAIMEAIDYGVLFMDSDLRYRYCNKAYRDLWNIPEAVLERRPTMEEFIRMNRHTGVYDVADDAFDDFVAARIAAVRAGPVPPTEMTRADGRTLIYQKVALRDGGAMLTYFDITARKDDERRLNEAYEVISSSIQYASRIQRSILPDPRVFDTLFADHFVHWEPRDVVGGDIYWCDTWGAGALVVLGDCTGHGVPGAFMTLIAIGALDRALAEVAEGDVAGLMSRMHQLVQVTLNQHGSGGESDDGMELGICYLPPGGGRMTYVGARFSLFVVAGGGIEEIKGNRTGIGYRHVPHDAAFTEVQVALGSGRSFYMTSDGLVDQLGGPKRRAFGKRRFKELIAAFDGEAFAARRDLILQTFAAYQGDEPRRDDVALMGFTLDGAAAA
ncbi:MAG: PAS-domain containing protein [Hyphomicrobiales bacterium]|nr:PAS-domain containing protein [Hyphomicrobiales bacterium]